LDFNLDFNLVRSQKLLLIPQLKLALDILTMDSRELFDFLEDQLGTNPALEADMDVRSIQDNNEDETDAQMQEENESTMSLKQHLIIQLNTMHLDKSSLMIGEYLIDNTDDNGYLKVDISEAAEFFDVPLDRVAAVLNILQSLDPPGICARTLAESLLLQLKQLDDTDEDAVKIVGKYLDRIAADDVKTVSDETGLTMERVREIFCKVKSLEPKPGREFYNDSAQSPAPPDIIIKETSDGLQVLNNDEAVPDICISESFRLGASLLAETKGGEYVHENVKSAVWLIKCLEQRKNIIYDIASRLLACEPDFFRNGSKSVQKLDKSSFAAYLSMHESIFEKALNGKFLQCRWGTFDFGYFFNEGEEDIGVGLF
jgi:RNA polymerase sigma-54 factor